MRLYRVAIAAFVLAGTIAAQRPSFDVPLTYFVGASGSNEYPFASPRAVFVGPGGDIWVVGVAQSYGLPIVDPDDGTPSEAPCLSLGGQPSSPFEPGNFLRPCDLFAMRLAPDGSGARFVKYVGSMGLGIKTL